MWRPPLNCFVHTRQPYRWQLVIHRIAAQNPANSFKLSQIVGVALVTIGRQHMHITPMHIRFRRYAIHVHNTHRDSFVLRSCLCVCVCAIARAYTMPTANRPDE